MKNIGNIKANQQWNPDEVRNPPPTNMEESERDSELEKYIRCTFHLYISRINTYSRSNSQVRVQALSRQATTPLPACGRDPRSVSIQGITASAVEDCADQVWDDPSTASFVVGFGLDISSTFEFVCALTQSSALGECGNSVCASDSYVVELELGVCKSNDADIKYKPLPPFSSSGAAKPESGAQ